MNNMLYIKKIDIKQNEVVYKLEYNGKWEKFICNKKFFIKYNTSVEKVPNSILYIPIICDLLPIMWVNDLSIEIDELDLKFYENIEKIKIGYKNMYPNVEFKGNLSVKKFVDNEFKGKNSCVMFSGGVDAFNTLFSHIDEKPDLITIFGADIDLNDDEGISIVQKSNKKIAKKFDLNYNDIFSNFRTLINYNEVNNVVKKYNYEWWHDFQHGIALLGLTAPLSYVNNYSVVYIASSFTETEKGNYTCASDPTIDNFFSHSSSTTIHDGYEYNRQDKIHNICNYVSKTNEKINIRVCWQSKGGKNCCSCEKCYRTILAILAEGKNPKDFGFELSKIQRKKMMIFLKLYLTYNKDRMVKVRLRYDPIKKKFLENIDNIPKDLLWLGKVNIGSKKNNIITKLIVKILLIDNKITRRIKNG